LEKLANKLDKLTMFKNRILFLLFLLLGNTINAQETTLEKGKEYILAGVEVTGKVSFNEQTVITFTGLEIGSKIRIPGDEISLAITKLWKLGLFNDVNFYVKKIEGETIFLERSRLCLYWSADMRGFMGLASIGPNSSCKIGPPADITLRSITAVLEVTAEAEAKWIAAK